MRKRWVAVLLVFLATSVHAQGWPDKPVRLVVPYPPGGNVDSAARITSQTSMSIRSKIILS